MTQPRTIFAEEFSTERFVKVVVFGDWDEDMAEALKSFMARRCHHRSAPIVETTHNSGEGLPSSDAAEVGADTQADTGSVT